MNLLSVILTSTVLATIISSIANWIFNKQKDKIDNITKERKAWRDELRSIAVDIQNSKSVTELKVSVCKLKVRINTYGYSQDDFLCDSHIWKLIETVEDNSVFSAKELKNIKNKLTSCISNLLKFDWDRSKKEVLGDVPTRVTILSLLLSFLLCFVGWFIRYNNNNSDLSYLLYFFITFMIMASTAMISITVIDKWDTIVRKKSIIWLVLISIGFATYLIYTFIQFTCFTMKKIDIFVLFIESLIVMYCTYVKYLNYKKSMMEYLSTIVAITGIKTLPEKYMVFFTSKDLNELILKYNVTFK